MLSRRRTLTLFVVLCLGHVLLISAQVQSGQGRSVLHARAFGAVAAVQGSSAAVTQGAGGLWSHYIGLVGASRENEQLRARVVSLEGELQAERARAAAVTALEQALKMQQSVVSPTLAARVIAGSPAPGTLTVTIDRGTSDGVTSNMAVIAGAGVVGRVIGQPTARAALVQLINGKSANTGAMLEKAGDAGLAAGGFADGFLRLELLSSGANVAAGDRVVTSGQDGIYPPGFVIGQVTAVNGSGKAREILIAPAVKFLARGHRARRPCAPGAARRRREAGRGRKAMKTPMVVGVVVGSVLLQVLLAQFAIGGRLSFDLVLVGVVFVALQSGPVAGMLAGTIGGVMLDLMSGGLVGVGGLLKTIVGFAAGLMGTRLVVAKPYARALIVAAATVMHSFMSMGLQAAIDKWSGVAWTAMLGETAINLIAAYLAFLTIEALPGTMSRGRTRQRSAWGRRQW